MHSTGGLILSEKFASLNGKVRGENLYASSSSWLRLRGLTKRDT